MDNHFHLLVETAEPNLGAAMQWLKEWSTFRDRYGDWGRDLVLYLGRKECGLRLRELGEAAGGIDYVSVGAAVQRFARRLTNEKSLAERLREARQPVGMQNAET